MDIMNAWSLIVGVISDSLNLDWSELSYKRSSLVIKAAVFIVAVLFTTRVVEWWRSVSWRKKSNSHYLTGLVPSKSHEPGIVFKLVRGLTWCLAVVSLCFLGVALADPIVFITDTTELIKSREIIYIKDVSASNGFHLPNSNVSRGELAYETLEKLILKRKDKRDRAAYIVFGTHSEIWSGLTTSLESLMFSISMSPIALAPSEAPSVWPGMFILKKGQYTLSETGGATNLHLGLESAIYLFDRKGGSPKIIEELKQNLNAKMRSVIIITDGAADIDPEPQFRELQKRGIIPYLVFVDPDRTIEKQLHGENSIKAQFPTQLLKLVRQSGGQYFMAKDQKSVDQISEMLDKIQSVKQIKKTSVREEEVYFIPLAMAFLFAITAMAMRVLSLLMWRIV